VQPAMTDQSGDDAVLARIRGGDSAAFEQIMRRHNQRLFRAARAVVKDDAEAEDVVQQAYVSAFTHLAGYEGRAQLSTWLLRIVLHEALGRLRARGRTASLDDAAAGEEWDVPTNARSPEDAASDRELVAIVETSIDTMPDAFRTVFMLRAVEGMSAAEVAEALDVPEETVRTRLHRARAHLQRALVDGADRATPRAFEFLRERCDRIVAAVLARIGPSAH